MIFQLKGLFASVSITREDLATGKRHVLEAEVIHYLWSERHRTRPWRLWRQQDSHTCRLPQTTTLPLACKPNAPQPTPTPNCRFGENSCSSSRAWTTYSGGRSLPWAFKARDGLPFCPQYSWVWTSMGRRPLAELVTERKGLSQEACWAVGHLTPSSLFWLWKEKSDLVRFTKDSLWGCHIIEYFVCAWARTKGARGSDLVPAWRRETDMGKGLSHCRVMGLELVLVHQVP